MVIYGCSVNRFQIRHRQQVKNTFCFSMYFEEFALFQEFAYFMSLFTMAFAKDFQNSTKTVSVFAYYFRVGPFNDMGEI